MAFIPPLPSDIHTPRHEPRQNLPPQGSPSRPAQWLPNQQPPYAAPGLAGPGLAAAPVYVTPYNAYGVSDDFVGFGAAPGVPPQSAWSQPATLHPHTPWGAGAGLAPPGTGFMPNQPLPHAPNYAAPPPQQAYPAQYGLGASPWQHAMYFTTPGPVNRPLDPVGQDPVTGAPLSRPKKDDKTLDYRFIPGRNYCPVLEPLQVSIVKCTPSLNPLLRTISDDRDSQSRDFLKWNMLFSSSYAQRSSEGDRMSWADGRDDPATFPRVTSLRIMSRSFPWIIDIRAADPSIGVTCADVIDQLSTFLLGAQAQSDFESEALPKQRLISKTYYENRSAADGVPGGRMGRAMCRVDWLGRDTMFDGLERDTEFVRHRISLNSRRDIACMWVLRCGKRPGLSDSTGLEERLGATTLG